MSSPRTWLAFAFALFMVQSSTATFISTAIPITNRVRSGTNQSCIVTNVAVTVTPEELVKTTIDFVTSGLITLREGYLPAYLEQTE